MVTLVHTPYPPEDSEPVTHLDDHLLLSTALDSSVFEPCSFTLAALDGYSVKLYRFADNEPVELFELAGQEVEQLIAGYHAYLQRYEQRRTALSPAPVEQSPAL